MSDFKETLAVMEVSALSVKVTMREFKLRLAMCSLPTRSEGKGGLNYMEILDKRVEKDPVV